jgi:hypothetical protein
VLPRAYLPQAAVLRESHVLGLELMQLIRQSLESSITVVEDAAVGDAKSLAIAEILQDAGFTGPVWLSEHLQTATLLVVLSNWVQVIRLREPEFRDSGLAWGI